MFLRCVQLLAKSSRSCRTNIRSLVSLAGRPGLVGTDRPSHPKFIEGFTQNFPYRIDGSGVEKQQVEDYARDMRPKFDELLLEHGVILIRGLPLETAHDFSLFFHALGHEPVLYIAGSSSRTEHAPMVLDTTKGETDEHTIEPHTELSYFSKYPHLFFCFAEVAPAPGTGGENGLTDMREVLKTLDPVVVQKFNRLGIRYHRCMTEKNDPNPVQVFTNWQTSFNVETKEEVERVLKETGHAPHQWSWDEANTLRFWTHTPALRPHYKTGEIMWFNQVDVAHWSYFTGKQESGNWSEDFSVLNFPITSFYGDGTDLERDVLQHLRETLWRCTRAEQAQKGDVLVLDNMRFAHSKLGFTDQRVMKIALARYKSAEI